MNKTSIPNINNKSKYHKKSKPGINKKTKKIHSSKAFFKGKHTVLTSFMNMILVYFPFLRGYYYFVPPSLIFQCFFQINSLNFFEISFQKEITELSFYNAFSIFPKIILKEKCFK